MNKFNLYDEEDLADMIRDDAEENDLSGTALVNFFYSNYFDCSDMSDDDFRTYLYLRDSDRYNANTKSNEHIIELLAERCDVVNVEF